MTHNVSELSTSSKRRKHSPAPGKYTDIEERRKSFLGVQWPPHLNSQPDALAKAGFYFYAPPDRVKCAFCYGCLKKWQSEDNAIEEHVKHFPNCPFVKSIELQTAILSKSFRAKGRQTKYVNSEDLIKKHVAEKMTSNKASAKNLWRNTLKKLGYSERLVKHAEQKLRHKKSGKLELSTVLQEVQRMEKERVQNPTNESASSADNEDNNGNADDEEDDDGWWHSFDEEQRTVCIDERIKQLREEVDNAAHENEQLHNLTMCKICWSNRIDTLFLTCRHLCACHDCAERVKDCPVCREIILGTVDVFWT